MISNATIIPLRTLTPDKEGLLRKFYAPSGVGLFLATYLPLTICLSLGGAFFSATGGLIAGLLISAIWVTWRHLSYRSRVKKVTYVYEYGARNEMQFSDVSSNYSYKVNGAPQQIITVLLNGRPIKIKTFNPNLLSVYRQPQQVAYTHPDYPGTVVPSGLFSLVWDEPKKGFARVPAVGVNFVAVPLCARAYVLHQQQPWQRQRNLRPARCACVSPERQPPYGIGGYRV